MNTKERLTDIMCRQAMNEISYEEARKEAEPIIEEFNTRSIELANKAKKRPILLSFDKMFGKVVV